MKTHKNKKKVKTRFNEKEVSEFSKIKNKEARRTLRKFGLIKQ